MVNGLATLFIDLTESGSIRVVIPKMNRSNKIEILRAIILSEPYKNGDGSCE
jgi:hypothetical protein